MRVDCTGARDWFSRFALKHQFWIILPFCIISSMVLGKRCFLVALLIVSSSRFPCYVLIALSWNIQVQMGWAGQSTRPAVNGCGCWLMLHKDNDLVVILQNFFFSFQLFYCFNLCAIGCWNRYQTKQSHYSFSPGSVNFTMKSGW